MRRSVTAYAKRELQANKFIGYGVRENRTIADNKKIDLVRIIGAVTPDPTRYVFDKVKLQHGFTAKKSNLDCFIFRRMMKHEFDDPVGSCRTHHLSVSRYVTVTASKVALLCNRYRVFHLDRRKSGKKQWQCYLALPLLSVKQNYLAGAII